MHQNPDYRRDLSLGLEVSDAVLLATINLFLVARAPSETTRRLQNFEDVELSINACETTHTREEKWVRFFCFFRESACTRTAESKTSLPPHWVRSCHSMRERSLLLEKRTLPHDPNTHNCHNARALPKSTVPINFPHLKFFYFYQVSKE